jgi:hypothetical protein
MILVTILMYKSARNHSDQKKRKKGETQLNKEGIL